LIELFSELSNFFKEHQKKIHKENIFFNLAINCENKETYILTDKVKLKQIFINLIGNAFKFTENGRIEGGCKLNSNNHLVFYVSDTGIGIPIENHKKVFERFTQLNPGENKLVSGTGLGLSIVKGLVGLLGGEIWLESEPGNGTTFYFSIPYKFSKSSSSGHGNANGTEKYFFEDVKVLIVEDDFYNTEYLKEILEGTGLIILHTKYGKEAVQIALTQTLDVVLMDIRLPDIDGYEATQQIKKVKPELVVIAQTAYASVKDRNKALSCGCNDYISKPISRKKLLSAIDNQLKK
jgi:CheY-like chemotaxis protein